MLFALMMAGCKDTVVTTIPGEDAAISLHLINPTVCETCDPFLGVDTIQLDVVQDGELVASERFAWPDADLSLPDLDGFGVVTIQMRGERAGEVISFGQTPEIAVGPGSAIETTLQFLPANRALPLAESMVQSRRRHMSVSTRAGRALLMGGFGDGPGAALASVEAYDPTTGTFAEAEVSLPLGLADATVNTGLRDGVVLIIGGVASVIDGVDQPSAEAILYWEEHDTLESIEPMSTARAGHCVSTFLNDRGLVLGGHTGTSLGDFVRWDTGASAWVFGDVPFTDLDETRVTGCATLADHRTFVQGASVESTGIWAFTAAGGDESPMEAAFLPTPPADAGEGAAFVIGAAIVPLSSGDAWVGGGVDPRTGTLASAAREFRADTQRFDPADAQAVPRVWGRIIALDDVGTVAWGCGWRDTSRSAAVSSLEVFNVEFGTSIAVVPFVETRSGCEITRLPDGAILVTGGGSATAEIVVPFYP